MQQCQGRLSKMFLCHHGTKQIGSLAPNSEVIILPLVWATRFPFKEGSQHGLPSLPCTCAPYQNTRVVFFTEELFTAMVCSRFSLCRLILSAKNNILGILVMCLSCSPCATFSLFLWLVLIQLLEWPRFQINLISPCLFLSSYLNLLRLCIFCSLSMQLLHLLLRCHLLTKLIF